jgi:lipoate-protein ligase A
VILWLDGAHDAPECMRRDAALLAAAERTPGEPFEAVLRVFAFAPPGITLGHAQDPARELDLARCERDGVRWAVRPTGGRAIFHADEWTYSLTARLDDPAWGGSLERAYTSASRLVAASLRRLGVPAELVAARAPAAGGAALAPRAGDGPAAPCFASTARHEIELEGRKLVGSAQRRLAHALLQQGSVLLGEGHLRLADYLALDEARRAVARTALARVSAVAGPYLPAGVTLGEWADALAAECRAGTRRLDGPDALRGLTG